MNLLIVGDCFPSKVNQDFFEKEKIESVFDKEILDFISDSDFSCANLEGVFYDGEERITKQGPHLVSSVRSFKGYSRLGFDVVNLANNHSGDCGETGLFSTMSLLEEKGIIAVGAGKNDEEARKPAIIEKNGYKVGIISFAEYEFTIARKNKAGAAHFDELYSLDEIVDLRNKVDYLVVLYHGGKERYRYPVPYVQKRCRRFVEKGADIVLCQHSHCIGSEEHYGSGYILYGQGNFCLCRADDEFTKNGLMIKVDLEKRDINKIPIVRDGHRVRMPNNKENKDILSGLSERSKQIEDNGFVIKNYYDFAKEYRTVYDGWRLGVFRKFYKLLVLMGLKRYICKLIFGKSDIDIINLLRCEAHRDIYLAALVEEEKAKSYE